MYKVNVEWKMEGLAASSAEFTPTSLAEALDTYYKQVQQMSKHLAILYIPAVLTIYLTQQGTPIKMFNASSTC